MKQSLSRFVWTLAMLATLTAGAYGQATSTSSLSGVVVDKTGGVIPGADVTIKNQNSGTETKAVTTENGTFSAPALSAGSYIVTVSLTGFKQAVLNNVEVVAATPATIRVTLEVGSPTETVLVEGGAEVVQSQTANITTTLSTKQIVGLPLQSRNVIYYFTLLPGVSSAATASPRSSTINGLPSSAYNITMDGLNTQDNTNKNTDGFFSYISPSVDAIQEVTLSTATPGAESAGQGAIQIKFVTRSGNNQYHGSVYEYNRNTKLNSNYWFTNRDATPVQDEFPHAPCTTTPVPDNCHAARSRNQLNQFGGRIGGPLSIPWLFNGHDKAFFFINLEEMRVPASITRTRTILNPLTQSGVFQYTASGSTQQVNLLTLAASKGQVSTIDPIVGKLLADIRASTGNQGIVQLTNPNVQSFTFNNPGGQTRYFPTVRLDFNLTQKHHLENSYNYQRYISDPDLLNNVDPTFPGFPNHGGQFSHRFSDSLILRSTLSPRVVNEARFGFQGGTVSFFGDVGQEQFANQGNFSLGISSANPSQTITNATVTRSPEYRNAPVWEAADTVTWTRGAHSLSFGGQWTQAGLWISDQDVVPTITFGLPSSDPASSMFTTANFPNASGTNLSDAMGLYAVLTGRVTSIGAQASLDEKTGKYGYLAAQVRRARQREWGFFVSDSWRARPNLTLTGGLRYELQLPFEVRNDVYATSTVAGLFGVSGPGNLFKPGTQTGSPTLFTQLKNGDDLYKTQYNNLAPSVGFAWSPNPENGFLKKILGGNGATVIRGGYSIAFNRQGSASVLNFYDSNPGLFFDATRSTSIGNLVTGTGSDVLPVLLRDTARLGPAAFPAQPTYPFTGQISDQVNIFDPNLKTPYTQSFSIGIQRELTKDMALEVRYIHTLNLQEWSTYNYNETNIVENGFLNEFKLAQANLQANIAAGRGNTFKYAGPGTGTSPLPIYLAYFSGLPAAQATDTTKYTSTNFSSTNFTTPLATKNPLPYTTAGTSSTQGLQGNATLRQNAVKAGLASNFFVVNPDLLGAPFTESNGGYHRYDGLQVDLRKRMASGLLIEANYVFARGYQGNRASFRQGWYNSQSTLNGGTLKHAFKVNWVYELPVGRGKRFLGSSSGFGGSLVNHILGGWEIGGTGRIQTGAVLNMGNVRAVGMTQKDVQAAYGIRYDDANKRVYMFPQDIIDNTIKAYSTSATSTTGYGALGPPTGRYFAPANSGGCIQIVNGDCASQALIIQGPHFTRFDLNLVKKFSVAADGRVNLELRGEFLNAFNNINFLGNSNLAPSSSQSFGQVTTAYRDTSNTFDNGGRIVQLVLRLNW